MEGRWGQRTGHMVVAPHLVVGRTLLYPANDDVAAAVDTAAAMIR